MGILPQLPMSFDPKLDAAMRSIAKMIEDAYVRGEIRGSIEVLATKSEILGLMRAYQAVVEIDIATHESRPKRFNGDIPQEETL
jgi:hypothetical protein